MRSFGSSVVLSLVDGAMMQDRTPVKYMASASDNNCRECNVLLHAPAGYKHLIWHFGKCSRDG